MACFLVASTQLANAAIIGVELSHSVCPLALIVLVVNPYLKCSTNFLNPAKLRIRSQ
jgi:hypothetical protein